MLVGISFLAALTFSKKSLRALFHSPLQLFSFVLGTVTDGEFNSIWTMGEKRAVSIIQVIMDAKAEARKTNVNTIRRYLTPVKVQGIYFPININL